MTTIYTSVTKEAALYEEPMREMNVLLKMFDLGHLSMGLDQHDKLIFSYMHDSGSGAIKVVRMQSWQDAERYCRVALQLLQLGEEDAEEDDDAEI